MDFSEWYVTHKGSILSELKILKVLYILSSYACKRCMVPLKSFSLKN